MYIISEGLPTTSVLTINKEVAYLGSFLSTVKFICGISMLREMLTYHYAFFFRLDQITFFLHFSCNIILIIGCDCLKLKELDDVVEDREDYDCDNVALAIQNTALKGRKENISRSKIDLSACCLTRFLLKGLQIL